MLQEGVASCGSPASLKPEKSAHGSGAGEALPAGQLLGKAPRRKLYGCLQLDVQATWRPMSWGLQPSDRDLARALRAVRFRPFAAAVRKFGLRGLSAW